MPSLFCCRCHNLVTADESVNPDAFVCCKCNEKKLEVELEKKQGNANPFKTERSDICSIAEWK